MTEVMRVALDRAKVKPEQVDYINAHATATKQGDQEEAESIEDLAKKEQDITQALDGIVERENGANIRETLYLDTDGRKPCKAAIASKQSQKDALTLLNDAIAQEQGRNKKKR
jgi:hypothetical protein